MKITELLAKSDGTTLRQHTDDVGKAAQRLHTVLDAAPDTTRAAFYHDLGKASVFFQDKMYGGNPENWYRHELFSLLMAFSLDENKVLSELELAAIATHHRNLDHTDISAWAEQESVKKLETLAREQLPQLWHLTEKVFGRLPKRLNTIGTVNFLVRITELAEANTVWSKTGNELAMYRAALVAADHLASSGIGLTIKGHNITRQALEEYARKEITNWQDWSDIQKEAEQKKGNAVLVAPTGSGKTEAALLWAMNNRQGSERIFYVLPYQVSINAMAERISKAFPDAEGHKNPYDNQNVSILHSNMDLAYLQDALNDSLPPAKAIQVAIANKKAARKIYAPIKVTTVYQLLDIFFGRKFFEVGLLELTNSLVIFDEIHAYDGHTMGLILVLLHYLRELKARTFIMTATLPITLRETLERAAGVSKENIVRLAQDSKLANEVRRKIFLHKDSSIQDMVSDIRTSVEKGNKTIVVCNTVDKAIFLWSQLQKLHPLLIHSRFTIGDRAQRESKKNLESYLEKHKLVISTQVIEVSLDISCAVMFTELAPIDALLQRFGRVNRHGEPDPFNLGICHVACGDDKGSQRIYDTMLLQQTREMLFWHSTGDEPYETTPVDFIEASKWVEQVYPKGLSEKGTETMEATQKDFTDVVSQLKPMLDPPAKVENLELTLFNSVQVVPAQYAQEWCDLKANGKHLEAKRLIVSVDAGVWQGYCDKHPGVAEYVIRYGKGRFRREQIVALCEYEEDTGGEFNGTGLRLDRLPIPNPMTKGCIISDDSDD